MKKKENNISLLLGVPGLILQIAGYFVTSAAQQQGAPTLIGNGLTLVGTILLISGLCFYAIAKGRSPLWGLMGLLSCIGLLVLAVLKDKSNEGV
jgi:hypothetical protein